ncbi:MAG: Cna B-type domain-containing protein, partial [Longicatena sp.]
MKNYKRVSKKISALLLTVLMIVGMIPTSVFAALPDKLTATTDRNSPQRLMRFNDGTVAYCIEPDDEQPGDSLVHGDNPVHYTRDDNYTALTEDQKDLIKYIIHVGYPTNAANIQGGMTDPIFEKTTQFAIFKSLGTTEPDGLFGVKQANVNKILNKAKEFQTNNKPIDTQISINPAQLTMNAQNDGTFRSDEVAINSNPASQNIKFETIPNGITVHKADLSGSYRAGDVITSGTKVIIQSTKEAKGSNLKLSATSLNPRVILGIYVSEFNDIQNLLRIETTNDPATQNIVIDWKEVTPPPVPTKININVTKSWNDSNNQDGIRPNSVNVKLFADGTDTKQSVTLNEGNKWTASFTDLAEYKNGTKIVYTIKEEAVTGYTSNTTGDVTAGFTITNTHTPEKISVTGSKTWEDNNNQDGKRPTAITINLLADGVKVDTKTVTEADGWSWNFTNLAKYKAGTAINYTVMEATVKDYQTKVTGYNITNTYIPGKTSISVTKSWNDSNNQDGIRPNSVNVKLFADGTDTKQSVTLNEGNKWTASFTDLAEYKNGTKIVYTIKEEAVTGYTSNTTGDVTAGFTITNTHTPEKISVTGSKTWEDNNNQDGKRPTAITINLLADGVKVDTKTVTEADGWSWNFTNLAKYKAGTAINYTVMEATVKDYQTKVTGYNITNTYIPGKTSISVTKSWNDSNNQDGIRPNSV